MTDIRDGIIQTKLSAPSLPFGLVVRGRLHARLDSHPARFVLISAPAGFGKTALILDWLEHRSGQTAWLSIDRSDNDPTRFFNHLSAALASLPLAGAERAAGLVRTLGQRSGAAPDVQEAFASLGGEVVLVLDDIHEIEEPRVLGGLEQLLATRGPGPRLVLLTRVDPPLSLGRLRVSGELLELRERDLRFTRAECTALFSELLPGGLEPRLVGELELRTEGWAAGLRLAAIALQDVADPAAAVAAFAGSHRIVVDYLVEEAVEKQSERVQQFLMDTSILERFTPDACTAVTQDSDSRARLAEVEAANLFLVPLGSERHWYRYHHLFRELLQFRLRRLCPDRADLLHGRASAWFEQAGDVHAAIEHACQIEDRTRLLELLDRHALDILATSELATLARWLGRLPDLLCQPYPMLIAAVGWLRVLTERAPDLQPVFAAAESAFARAGSAYDARRRWQAQARLEVLRAFEARFAGRLEESLLISRAVLQDLAEEEPFTRGLVTYNLARLEMVMGEMEPALQLLERSFSDNLRAGNLYVVLTGLGQAAAVRGQLEGVYGAREELNAAVAFAEQRHLTGLPAFSTVLYHLGNIEYIADRLDEAQAACERAVEVGRTGNFPEGYANGLVILARVASARSRFDQAEALLTEAAALARSSNVLLLDTTVALEQARLALAREQMGAGPPTAPIELAADSGCWTTFRETEQLLHLRRALRAQDHQRAAGFATQLQRESEVRGRGIPLTVALLAQALLPQRPDRWETLDRALRLAAMRGYIRPLIDPGELVRPLLQASLAHPLSAESRAHARLLLERLDRNADRAAAAGPLPTLLEPLTGREEEVLRYLFDGLSNKAIARAMFVSGETVKTHLKHLYWKLGAAGREEAVARARELGLAPLTRI